MAGIGGWLSGLLAGGKIAGDGPSGPPASARPAGATAVAEGNNAFALAMFGALRPHRGNLAFSPFSVRAALAMTQAGARGETAAQLSEVLRTASPDGPGDPFLASIIRRPDAASGGTCEMAVANSLWCQNGAPLQPGFLELIDSHFHGVLNLVDFRRAAERARVAINRWVEDNTGQRIRDLIPFGMLSPTNRLVLANAVYFKGTWLLPFNKAATRDEPFHLEGGGTVPAPLMRRQEEVWYGRGLGCQAADLAYTGSELSMLVLLPDRKDGLRDLERTLSARALRQLVSTLNPREVSLFLPRFRIAGDTVDMRPTLGALGLTLPFDPAKADFSGINGCRPPDEEALFFSVVLHKAVVDVNEEGTEAAAATALLLLAGARPGRFKEPSIPVFRADHPFLFAIRDRRNGGILFLGRVADPTREA